MSIQNTLDSLVPPKVFDASICIVAIDTQERVLHQFGTGTLLRIANDSFLVTAAHVVTLSKELRCSLCIGVKNGFVQLQGEWYLSSETTPYDIAVLRLPIEVANKLTNVYHIRLHDVDFGTSLLKGVFCLVGYPNRLSIPSTTSHTAMNVTPFRYLTYAYEGNTEMLAGYQEKYHLLLVAQEDGIDNDGKPIKLTDRNGLPLEFPKHLGGMSGCSIWKIGEQNELLSNWKHHRPKIVAVQTGVYSDAQLIKTTRWLAVSTLLYQIFPDLRQAMSLWHVEY